MSLTTWIKQRAGQLTRFGVVGVAGVLVNLGVFNLLRLGPLSAESDFLGADDRVLTAKVIATVVSIVFAWIAHRGWTFRGGKRHRATREIVLFGAVNVVALAVEAGVLALSHYGLGLTSPLADNIASLLGIGLATVVRYSGYSLMVFRADARFSDGPV